MIVDDKKIIAAFNVGRQDARTICNISGGTRRGKTSQFLDNLAELLSCTEEMTTDELMADLREEGINPDEILGRIQDLLAKYGITMKIAKRKDNNE